MALKIARKTPYGIEANYWKVAITNINWHEKQATVILFGFIDEKARIENSLSIDRVTFGWVGEDFPFTFEGKTVEETYNKIKEKRPDEEGNETNEWAKAEDC